CPRRAMASAAAAPIPLLAPVMTTTFSSIEHPFDPWNGSGFGGSLQESERSLWCYFDPEDLGERLQDARLGAGFGHLLLQVAPLLCGEQVNDLARGLQARLGGFGEDGFDRVGSAAVGDDVRLVAEQHLVEMLARRLQVFRKNFHALLC